MFIKNFISMIFDQISRIKLELILKDFKAMLESYQMMIV